MLKLEQWLWLIKTAHTYFPTNFGEEWMNQGERNVLGIKFIYEESKAKRQEKNFVIKIHDGKKDIIEWVEKIPFRTVCF